MAKKTKKERIPAGVRLEFDDVDYWKDLKKSDQVVTLQNGKKIPVYDYMKKFMQEAYGNGFNRKNQNANILQTDDQKAWARRNNNNTNRDALLIAKKRNSLTNNNFLLEQATLTTVEPWEDTLKTSTYDKALTHLLELTAKDLGYPIDRQTKIGLLRFYFRIKKFLGYIRKDKKNEGI